MQGNQRVIKNNPNNNLDTNKNITEFFEIYPNPITDIANIYYIIEETTNVI